MDQPAHPHALLINKLGGPTTVAHMLRARGMRRCTVQRVSNWKSRGIPPRVWLEHAVVFEAVEVVAPAGGPQGSCAAQKFSGARDYA